MAEPTAPPTDDEFEAMWASATGEGDPSAPVTADTTATPDEFEQLYEEASKGSRGVGGPSAGGRLVPAQSRNTPGRFFSRLATDLNPFAIVGAIPTAAKAAWESSFPGIANSVLHGEKPLPTARALAAAELDRMGESWEGAKRDWDKGNPVRAASHVVGMVPAVGPLVSETTHNLAEGNFAEPLADAAAFAIPTHKVLPKVVSPVVEAARNRAAARVLGIVEPDAMRGPALRSALRNHPEMVTQLGVGDREKLFHRAKAIRDALGQAEEGLQSVTTPAPQAAGIPARLRDEATKYETTVIKQREVGTGLFDQHGNEIMRIEDYPVTTSQFPAYGRAVRNAADQAQELVDQYDGAPPLGTILQGRSASNRGAASAYKVTPGNVPTPAAAAQQAKAAAFKDVAHDPAFAHLGVKQLDEAYGRWKDMAVSLEKVDAKNAGPAQRLSMEMLKGRLGAKLMAMTIGGGAASAITGGGALPVMAGAAIGATLSASPFWNSLRATTYARIANAIERGAEDEAVRLVVESAVAYNQAKAAERHLKARTALETAGKGVVAP